LARSTYWLDPRGRSKGYEDCPSVLKAYGRDGNAIGERGLPDDVYRSDVTADGSGIIFLSRGGLIHAYDSNLGALFVERVGDLPEYKKIESRLGISERELKAHVRCVALSNDTRHYIYTVVDEAWCVGIDNQVRWGIRMPVSDEWVKCSERTERSGTSAEIQGALTYMGLALPVTPETIVNRYRKLALDWHPDRNPAPDSLRKMQELNIAMDLLTGVNLENLSRESIEHVTYSKIISRDSYEISPGTTIGFTASYVVSEKTAADWIYAANFAWKDDRAFLASYSGRIVEVSATGTPVRAYDIGAVPRRIVDAGQYLYILTDTRLYVLSGDQLEALIDVFGQGELIVGEVGFGLLEPKQLTWCSPTGSVLGVVRTKDPIRRVLCTSEGVVLETRRHRAIVRGAPDWWSQ
jgi:hypothetical protein